MPKQQRPSKPRKGEPRKGTTVKINEELATRAKHYAIDHKLTWGQVLDEALEDYLKKKGA